ncbi:MAG: formate/nitrite transporter family protein [Miniphocaeibacter sp.]|uniref:formate/nitrite transporter family protein n=1 Tax=Miniphocaeibacter sp. TaxID=3100973 RepID=UPI001798BC36|nr:formate/nitrite transporter family protein [Gallicola sp.]
MNFYQGNETIDILSKKAEEKNKMSFIRLFLLGILGGAFIALGYLAYLRILGAMPKELNGLGLFLGASIFPIGLIAIYLMNAELATGNTLTMTLGYLDKKVKIYQVLYNWLVIALSNILGALLVAYFFGHIVGLTEGAYLETTLNIAKSKIEASTMSALVSGLGGNIFVCTAVWIATSAKTLAGKIFGLWFPVMIFIVIGLQHAVANAFIIPAAIFSGQSTITVLDFVTNFLAVFLGNVLGGAVVVAIPVFMSNRKCNSLTSCELPYSGD